MTDLARRRDEPAGEREREIARRHWMDDPARKGIGWRKAHEDRAYLLAALTDRRAASGGTDEWRCEGCGEDVARADLVISHTRSEHHDECRGECVSCPVPVACGPVSQQRSTSGAGERLDAREACRFNGHMNDARCVTHNSYPEVCAAALKNLGDCKCGHSVGWHRFGQGACLECSCLEFKPAAEPARPTTTTPQEVCIQTAFCRGNAHGGTCPLSGRR